MDKLFELLGLGVPFYLAVATYFVFSWLDSNASDEATQVLSSWLRGHSHNKPDLGNLIISAFDRICTSPLLSFRAFCRSAVISTFIWIFVFLVPFVILLIHSDVGWEIFGYLNDKQKLVFTFMVIMTFVVNVLSDYVSLLFVRPFLSLHKFIPLELALYHQ
jgi:hypothetical protein